MTETWTCPWHFRELPRTDEGFCPDCMSEIETARDPADMTAGERMAELERWGVVLTVPFDVLHGRIEALVGRRVWTHEMGTAGWQKLIAEAGQDVRPRRDPSPSELLQSFEQARRAQR